MESTPGKKERNFITTKHIIDGKQSLILKTYIFFVL